MELGASIDPLGDVKTTLVQRVARYSCEKLCSYLVNHGATVDTPATDTWGTPLQEAIKEGYVGIANMLLEHGADINALPAKKRGVIALQAASIDG
ncbi:uncharacterized protein BJX67DRAFT_359138 [Aspergillus lucknowensis]|uniref:Ankyrin n=1 Tax=Aspergillus lucknowensis TaxID=176173 RepID=A0ABR4LPJ4_9EURO